MTDLVAVWHAEHANFSHLLDLLEKQVAAFRAGGQPNYDLMQDIVYYLRDYPDRVHHPQEEVAFAHLAARDPGIESQLDRLVQEHAVIAVSGEELLKLLEEIVAEVLVPRSTVVTAATNYLARFRRHLADEEQQVMPRAARLLNHEDWAAVVAAVPPEPDPLFGEELEARYRKLRRQIALHAQGS